MPKLTKPHKESKASPLVKVSKSKTSPVQPSLLWYAQGLIAGVDEAGRGPLAGPVVAAAVILDAENPIEGLNDSKKLSAKRRDYLFDRIYAQALCISVGQASALEIDNINILQATLLAMRRAIEGLRLKPVRVLIDGNRIPDKLQVLSEAIVGGDALIAEISAASIIAKVTRDRLCQELAQNYPAYGFDAHKGYGTKDHLVALQTHGPCPEHRKSFAPVKSLLG